MSKLLKRALKSAILPSSILIAGKFLSVFLLISVLGVKFSVTNEIQNFFSIQLNIVDQTTAIYINSLSNFICLLLIAIPTFVILFRNTLLKDAQSNPRVVVRLSKLNILKWVTGPENSLIKVIVWTIFLWIITGICISQAVSNSIYPWIGVIAGVLSLLSSYGILRTFEKETAKIYPEDN
ncbi:hypothetical protein M0R04_02240 [Candidatus Dojkabacteria bacterium]|jgi:hypothetical protein|nr:hypothetical protein [Candidatus Dojkabacteria bacterium]